MRRIAYMFLMLTLYVSLAFAQCAADYGPVVLNANTDYEDEGDLFDTDNDCYRGPGEDVIYVLDVEEDGLYSFEEDFGTADLYLLTGCCSGVDIASTRNSRFHGLYCIFLEQGTYWLLLEARYEPDDYQLIIRSCEDPCEEAKLEDGIIANGDGFRYVETVDENSTSPNYEGFWESGFSCQDESVTPDFDNYGIGYYSWFNQDYGWKHFFEPNTQCEDLVIDSAYVVICAYDVDACFEEQQGPRWDCERDRLSGDQTELYPDELQGSDLSLDVTRFEIPTQLLFNDGELCLWLNIDWAHDECVWATTVNWSQLVVYYHACFITPEPSGYDMGDLPECYPYDEQTGGPANPIWVDNYAWLGDEISIDQSPNIPDLDEGDDGVVFLPGNGPNGEWVPCEEVCVEITVTTGEAYEGGPLYLWGWKDGNLDCDFDDLFCQALPDDAVFYNTECIIHGLPIQQGANQSVGYEFCFQDPGEMEGQHPYDGVFRFRLVSEELNCETAQTSVDPLLGETEDHIVSDLQLAVELLDFSARSRDGKIVLSWSTASESENEFFEIQRNSGTSWTQIGNRISGAGNSVVSHSYGFADENVTVGQDYQYRLIAVDIFGSRQLLGEVTASVTGGSPTVMDFRLYENFPNPFNPSTNIAYDLRDASFVSLKVFDVLGRQIAELVSGYQLSGHYTFNFEAGSLPSGVYFYRLETPQFSDMKKMVLLK